jgi:bifunctional NMN adenylyltransferase/nudix hydrolase
MRIEMTHRDYSAAVLIGRFQPFHNAHKELVEQALKIADKVVILVGSAHAAPSPKNPFTFEERKWMILDTFPEESKGQGHMSTDRVYVLPIRDFFYSDDMWLAQVQAVTSNYIQDGETVALLGNYKDESSYYLKMFPQWEFVSPTTLSDLNATALRDVLFDVKIHRKWADNAIEGEPVVDEDHKLIHKGAWNASVPEPVAEFLTKFTKTQRYGRLVEEFHANRAYRESWEVAPFPPTFITADAVVTCGGHVLVVTRGGNPGKGLLALPGGFVRSNERIKDAAVRELKEETRIKVDKPVLKRAIVDSEVFDYPTRSERGRTVTHAYHIKLEGKLPEVKLTGADDVVKCQWMPFVEVMRRADEFFEDHIHIINNFITS